MLEETKEELLKRVAHELSTVGTRAGKEVAEDHILGLLEKCFKALQPEETDLLLALTMQAIAFGGRPDVTEVRPQMLECDVVRFQNNKEKWVAFVGLLDGYPYEIFTGLQDDDEGIVLPKTVTHGKILKQVNPDGSKRYDFQFENRRGYKTTVEGLSEKFNKEYWNYAKLISGVLRYRMPLDHVVKLVSSLSLNDESINTWKVGVERALKKYLSDGNEDAIEESDK
jgi:ribonucleoside-diphosphate reductase alpha chain